MGTLIRDHFAYHGLLDGCDVLLGFSPNRVMPGRLVERVRTSDKLVSGLLPVTPRLMKSLYSRIVTSGTLHETNTLTAEIVKTTENAYRDVRIAYAAEVSRFCDQNDIDFFLLRDAVNSNLDQFDAAKSDPNAVPSGGLLVPTLGVGGHCLPKDGILLLWRRIEHDRPANTLIEQARRINDGSPAWTIHLAESITEDLSGMHVALLGAAYRFNSEDTRNSPSLVLAQQLLEKGALVRIHDPYVDPDDQNLRRLDLVAQFTNELSTATQEAEVLIACTSHVDYLDANVITKMSPQLNGVVDACNLWSRAAFAKDFRYTGIGRGTNAPSDDLVACATQGFRALERGFARELNDTIQFLNSRYAHDPFNRVSYSEVQRLAATCSTGCRLVEPVYTPAPRPLQGFQSTLVELASPPVLSAETGM